MESRGQPVESTADTSRGFYGNEESLASAAQKAMYLLMFPFATCGDRN